MSKHWLEANAPRLMAEIFRDFCMVSITLEEQFVRFDHAGNLSYAVLRETLGDRMNRGVLWRLKDTAHHLLRDRSGSPTAGKLLDWAIGYIFHEALKLLEDTHQHQYYAPGILAMAQDNPSPELVAVAADFTEMALEIQAEMSRTVDRMRRLLAHARLFFHRCYADQENNIFLSRMLHDREDIARSAFGGEYAAFLAAVYGKNLQTLHINAAVSLRNGGKIAEARAAMERAEAAAPDDPRLEALGKSLRAAGTEGNTLR